ncbi:MAG: S-methyl-5-thioribose-1-phosphate isomerase [Ignavibacteriae bacterium]|nr:S-methyl-5-thioribose-1-phosphate isomerase [Ignavibacteriota bacterium]
MNVQHITPIQWNDGKVRFLDQTLLPEQEVYIETDDAGVVAEAIRRLAIRGAPLIGIAAAYGVALATSKIGTLVGRAAYFQKAVSFFASTRPTAVNLFWSLQRMQTVFERNEHAGVDSLGKTLLAEAVAIHMEDAEMCRMIGKHGAGLLPKHSTVLTHCNTGRLATGGIGTALGVVETAWEQSNISHVYIDETRPLLQGARLTAWELSKLNIPATLVVDSAAGFLMKQGKVNAVIVGADRIAANGDVANKVGTYSLAVLSKHHGVPFYVAAPSSTLDFETPSGESIVIERRKQSEVSSFFENEAGRGTVDVDNLVFDVTPHELVSALITEQGVIHELSAKTLAELRRSSSVYSVGAMT